MPPITEIQEKALAIFSRYGLKSVNMDELAFHTGVSKKTLYQLFNSKEELVFSLFELIKEQWNTAVLEIRNTDKSPVYKMLAFYQLRFDYIARLNPAFLLKSGKQYETIYHFMDRVRGDIRGIEKELLEEIHGLGYLRKNLKIPVLVKAHETLFDYFAEQLNPTTEESGELFRHLIYPAIVGIVDPEKYNVEKDLERFF